MNDSLEIIAGARTDISSPSPLYVCKVEAGFPSPAEDYIEGQLDLNEQYISRPAATFFLRVSGESMIGAGIFPGDLLIVDRSECPRHGCVVIAVVDGDLTVKRLYRRNGQVKLLSENPEFPPILIGEEQDLQVWGVVTSAIRSFK